jgi:hypothetical protein
MGQVKNLILDLLDQPSHPLAFDYFEYQRYMDDLEFNLPSEDIEQQDIKPAEPISDELPF